MGGWIKLHRKIKDNWLWLESRTKSKFEAWMDLLMTAAHEPCEAPFDSGVVRIRRGEMVTSERRLAEEWGWDRKTVRRFLSQLEQDGMIVRTSTTKYTRITICNYDTYQGEWAEEGPTKGTSKGTTKGTSDSPAQEANSMNGGTTKGTTTGTSNSPHTRSKEIKNSMLSPHAVVDHYCKRAVVLSLYLKAKEEHHITEDCSRHGQAVVLKAIDLAVDKKLQAGEYRKGDPKLGPDIRSYEYCRAFINEAKRLIDQEQQKQHSGAYVPDVDATREYLKSLGV